MSNQPQREPLLSRLVSRAMQLMALKVMEELYRFFIAFGLALYLFIWRLPQGISSPLFRFTCIYLVYACVLQFWWKQYRHYSFNRGRYFRSTLDIIFALTLVLLTGGPTSPAFVILALPVFLAAQRYERTAATFVLVSVLVGFVMVCLPFAVPPLVGLLDPLFLAGTLSKLAAIAMVPVCARSVKLFLRRQLEQCTFRGEINPVKAGLDTVAELLRGKMSAQACLLFSEAGEKCRLRAVATADDGVKGDAALGTNASMQLSQELWVKVRDASEGYRFLSSKPLPDLFAETDASQVANLLKIKGTKVRSLLVRSFFYPWEGCQMVAVFINKEKSSPAVREPYLRDFTEEDQYLLGVAIDSLKSGVLQGMLRAERDAFDDFLDTGVTEEVSRFDADCHLVFANLAKLKFIGKTKEEVARHPFCWAFFHNRHTPCQLRPLPPLLEMTNLYELIPEGEEHSYPNRSSCLSCAPFAARWSQGEIEPWHLLYDLADHPSAKRKSRNVAHIRATRVTNSKGYPEVMETVYDATAKYRSLVLTSFMAGLGEGKNEDTKVFAARVSKLYGDLLFRRARVYQYNQNPERFTCLAAFGHKESMVSPAFDVPLTPQCKGDHDETSREWIAKGLDAPILLRCLERNLHLETERMPAYCKTKEVLSFPFSERVHSDKCSERLDIPLRFQGRLLGKISLDNFSEEQQRETHRFNADDVSSAWMAGRAVAYALSRREETAGLARKQMIANVAEELPLCIFVKNKQHKFEYGNKRFCNDAGTTPEAIVGKTDFDFYPHDFAAKYQADDDRVMLTGQTITLDESHPVPDGQIRDVRVTKSALIDLTGETVGVLGVFSDITETVRYFRRILSWHDGLLRNPCDIVFAYDIEGRITFANPTAVRILGYTSDELKAMSIYDILIAPDRASLENAIHRTETTSPDLPEAEVYEFEARTKDKRIISLESSMAMCEILPGKKGILSVAHDVTERSLVSHRLGSGLEWTNALWSIAAGLGRVADVPTINRLFLLAVTRGECLGFSRAILFRLSSDRKRFVPEYSVGATNREAAETRWKEASSVTFEQAVADCLRPSAPPRPGDLQMQIADLSVLVEEDGDLVNKLTLGSPVVRRQGLLHTTKNIALQLVTQQSKDQDVEYVFAPIFERTSLVGILWADRAFLPSPVLPEGTLNLLGWLCVEVERMKEALIKREMAVEAGIARDLARGMSYSLFTRSGILEFDLALLKWKLGEKHADAIRRMAESIDFFKHAGALATKDLRFAETGTSEAVDLDFNKVVEEVVNRRQTGSIILTVNKQSLLVRMNRTHAEDIVVELLANALDFADVKSPCIRLTTSREGGFARLDVTDNGSGVLPALRPHLFRRFKRYPEGRLGMGLAYVKGLAEAYGGNIEEIGTYGSGAHFVVKVQLKGERYGKFDSASSDPGS